MDQDEVQNRFGDPTDLNHLRDSSKRPSLVGRTLRRARQPRFSENAVTILLGVVILVALGVGYWVFF